MTNRTPREHFLNALGELIENASPADVAKLEAALATYKLAYPRAVKELRNSSLGGALFEVIEDSVGYADAMHKENAE